MDEKSPGLLLQAIPYLGQKKILKVLLPGVGVVSLMARKRFSSALLTPFCLAEWVYRKGNGPMCVLEEGTLIDDLRSLREGYSTLSAAGDIARDLLSFPGVCSVELFSFVCLLFQKLPSFASPQQIVSFFRVKWLKAEGFLHVGSTCVLCQQEASHLCQGESYCAAHGVSLGQSFSFQEWACLVQLFEAKRLSQLPIDCVGASFHAKLSQLFYEQVR